MIAVPAGRAAIGLLPLALVAALPASADDVLATWNGTWARYEAVEPPPGIPRATEGMLWVRPGEGTDAGSRIGWSARADTAALFGFEVVVEDAALLSPLRSGAAVRRYVLHPASGPPLEYVDRDGRALLPRFSFDPLLVPKVRGALPRPEALPDSLTWLGRAFRLAESGAGAPPWGFPATEDSTPRRVVLDPEVLVGTSRPFRDDGSGRTRDGDYTYVELTKADYRTMIDAGMNVFRVPARHLPWVIDEPVYFLTYEDLASRPEILFRSNYLGAVMYMDEPAHRVLRRGLAGDSRSPAESAELLVEVTRGRYEGDSGYGRRFLGRMLRRAGFRWGDVPFPGGDFPVWEVVTGAVWYELEAGPPGIVLEGRFRPRDDARLVRRALDVDFPEDARSGVLAHAAFLRGAARHFDAKWGIAIYGQMEDDAADLTFPLAYRRGATYFWMWTSDAEHHVPWTRQLALARDFRDFLARERADRGDAPREPIRAATALVLPWGYLMDEYALQPFARGEDAAMWRSRALALDKRNDAGAEYGDVLAAGYREAARLLEAGEEYDVLYLRADERADGYDAVIRVRESGEVERP